MSIAKYLSVIAASTIKFIGGPLTGVALGLSWLETAICTTLGMMLSVLVVTFAGAALQAVWQRFRKTPARRFTRRTRMAVRVWRRAGMAGIAFLTPLILTPIGGTLIALSFGVRKGMLLVYMLLSGGLWAVVQVLAIYQIPGLKGIFAH